MCACQYARIYERGNTNRRGREISNYVKNTVHGAF